MIETDCPGEHPADTESGNKSLRTELVHRHAAAVFAICLASTKRLHDAEDLMQETFMKAFTELDNLRDRNKARLWLVQIARRLCIDHLRRRKPASSLPDDLPAMPESHDSRIERLQSALAALPDDRREILTLYYLDGRNCAGAAATLGITQGAVRMRLLRARVMLYDLLTRDDK
jgi:RNA polymerase sigma-70 factor (ECF subfamily)